MNLDWQDAYYSIDNVGWKSIFKGLKAYYQILKITQILSSTLDECGSTVNPNFTSKPEQSRKMKRIKRRINFPKNKIKKILSMSDIRNIRAKTITLNCNLKETCAEELIKEEEKIAKR